jgi:hypothetical protein
VAIVQHLLVLGASMKARGSVDLTGVTWPDRPLFFLFSQDLVRHVAQTLADSQLKGKSTSGNGTWKDVVKYEYAGSIDRVEVATGPGDMTKVGAHAAVSMHGALLPLGVRACAITGAAAAAAI